MNDKHKGIYEEFIQTLKDVNMKHYSSAFAVKLFLTYCEKVNIDYKNVSVDNVREYKDYLSSGLNGKKYSEKTVRVYMSGGSLFYRFLARINYTDSNPFEDLNSINKNEKKKEVKDNSHISNDERLLINRYKEYLIVKGFKNRGITDRIARVEQFFDYTGRNGINPYGFNMRDCGSFREELHTRNYSNSTVNAILSVLNMFYGFLLAERRVLSNPFSQTERLRDSKHIPRGVYKAEEMEKLLSGIEIKTRKDFVLRTVIEVMYSTAARINEMEKAEVKDLFLEEGYMILRDDKEKQDRRVPLTEISIEYLRLYMNHLHDGRERIFYTVGKGEKDRSFAAWVGLSLRRISKKHNLPKITCHGIRHAAATHLYRNGADLREVQEYLGHRRICNTEIYTHIFPDDLKEMINKTHPREIGNEDSSCDKTL